MAEVSGREIDIPELRTPFLFRQQPVSIPADLRPAWRIGLIVLVMHNCCQSSRTSLTRLHVLIWGFLSADGRNQLGAAINGRLAPDAVVVRFEPFLLQAVDFAAGEGIVRYVDGSRVDLTKKGVALAVELEADESVYRSEKAFMQSIKKRLTENLTSKMFSARGSE